jgi:DNA-binding beta-propeller fold protein YncE
LPSRRGVLLSALTLASFALSPMAALSQLERGEVETFVVLTVGNRPEGIAVSHRGAVYVGNRIFDGTTITNQILAVNNDDVAAVFATLPDAFSESPGLLGLAIDRSGNLYAALASSVTFTQRSPHLIPRPIASISSALTAVASND